MFNEPEVSLYLILVLPAIWLQMILLAHIVATSTYAVEIAKKIITVLKALMDLAKDEGFAKSRQR